MAPDKEKPASSEPQPKREPSIHTGHRQRVKARLLEHGGQAVALMTGDSTNETLRQALRRSGAVHPAVQKLSHHGIGCRYFSEELQHAISPKYLVVSVDKEHCDEEMKKTVAGLAEAGNSCVHYTFQGDFAYCF